MKNELKCDKKFQDDNITIDIIENALSNNKMSTASFCTIFSIKTDDKFVNVQHKNISNLFSVIFNLYAFLKKKIKLYYKHNKHLINNDDKNNVVNNNSYIYYDNNSNVYNNNNTNIYNNNNNNENNAFNNNMPNNSNIMNNMNNMNDIYHISQHTNNNIRYNDVSSCGARGHNINSNENVNQNDRSKIYFIFNEYSTPIIFHINLLFYTFYFYINCT